MSFGGIIGVSAVLAAAVWLLWSLNRVSLAWTAAQNRIKELDQQRIDAARSLMKVGEELIRLKQEEKASQDKLAAARAQSAAKQKELAAFVPPPPQEIMISSEYPSARDDKPWIVLLARSSGSDAVAQKHYLVWASDHATALSRARYVLADEPGYEVVNAQRYG